MLTPPQTGGLEAICAVNNIFHELGFIPVVIISVIMRT
jgi:hypothetical protein